VQRTILHEKHQRSFRDRSHSRNRTALGSAREVRACLDVGLALGYVEAVDAELLARLNQVQGVLSKVVR
jgi:hypothetical protein